METDLVEMIVTPELRALAWACVLALVHVLAPAAARQRGRTMAWNMGPRDEPAPPPGKIAERLARAQANFFESFPIFVAAVLMIYVADLESDDTPFAAWLWLIARALYLPAYASGIPLVRSLLWVISVAALVILLLRTLLAA